MGKKKETPKYISKLSTRVHHIHAILSKHRVESILTTYTTIDGDVVLNSLRQMLISLKEKEVNKELTMVLFLDNAPVNKTAKIKDLCINLGVILLYNSPHSPQMNPIEEVWRIIKMSLKISPTMDWYLID